jgi:hypothetical protein
MLIVEVAIITMAVDIALPSGMIFSPPHPATDEKKRCDACLPPAL